MTGPAAWMGVPPLASGSFPAWREGMTSVDTWYSISNTSSLNSVQTDNRTINTWNGLAAGAHWWYTCLNGGDGAMQNGVAGLDLSQDVPGWVELDPGTIPANYAADTQRDPYHLDGRPNSRHTNFSIKVYGNRIIAVPLAGYALGAGNLAGVIHTDGFNLDTNTYDAAGTWADPSATFQTVCLAGNVGTAAMDPSNGNIYVAGYGQFARFNRGANTWTDLTIVGKPSGWNDQWQFKGSLIDVARNRWVSWNGPKVNTIDLTTLDADHTDIGAGWAATSATSATINTTNATMTFTLDDSVDRELFHVNHVVRLYAAASRSNFMNARVTAYSPPSLTVNPGVSDSSGRQGDTVPVSSGSGTFASWYITALTDSYTPPLHDLDNDRYLLAKANALYAMDPDTYAVSYVSAITPPYTGSGVLPGNFSMGGRMAYFQELGGVAYLPEYASNVLFMPTR